MTTRAPSEGQDNERLVRVLDEYATAVYIAARDDTDPPDVDAYARRLRAALSEQEPEWLPDHEDWIKLLVAVQHMTGHATRAARISEEDADVEEAERWLALGDKCKGMIARTHQSPVEADR